MSQFWSRHRPRGFGALRAALMLAWVAALVVVVGVGTQRVTVRAAQADDDALALFSKMMPVFSSPRCVNCHGGVDPASEATHGPGKVDVILDADGNMRKFEGNEKNTCIECHTDSTKNWRTAPRDMSFVGKDALALCRQIKRANVQHFLPHSTHDELIGLAFVGRSGIGEDSAFAPITPAPPPMSRDEFLAAAKIWIEDGHARCGSTWNFTIKYTFSKVMRRGGVDNAQVEFSGSMREGGTWSARATRVNDYSTPDCSYVQTENASGSGNGTLMVLDPGGTGHARTDRSVASWARGDPPVAFLTIIGMRYDVILNLALPGKRVVSGTCRSPSSEDFKRGIGARGEGQRDPKNPDVLSGTKTTTPNTGETVTMTWEFTRTPE